MPLRTLGLLCLASLSPLLAQSAPERISGFDPAHLDRQADPCVNFYQFACGTWIAKNPVPGDQSTWTRFHRLEQNNKAVLREILENAASKKVDRTPNEQRIGDYFAACMDEQAAERRGLAPVRALLDRAAAMKDQRDVARIVAEIHSLGSPALFLFYAAASYRNSKEMIAFLDAGGLSLPDREYYLGAEPRYETIRKEYAATMTRMLTLAGESPSDAAVHADAVLRFETKLAEATLDRAARRDPNKRNNPKTLDEARALAPSFDWKQYFEASGAPAFASLNVTHPPFYQRIEEMAKSVPMADWRAYLRWHALSALAPVLTKALADEDHAFFQGKLRGVKEQPPRWRMCAERVDRHLGEALGAKYVERVFQQDSRERMNRMVALIEKAMEKDIRELPWMTPATKRRALEKLAAIRNKVGHPERWRDYERVRVTRDDPFGNAARAEAELHRHNLAKIGSAVDPLEWVMTPPTVNAYYSGSHNSINFPAGILQPPFFDANMDEAVNYGAIGAVIGHELTHGFDDQGRKFAADGALRDWWTPDDAKEFEKRAQCFVDQYGSYDGARGMKLNGRLTLGENTADNGGLRIAYMALMMHLAGKETPKIDGFTPQQRFFLGLGQIWCGNRTPEAARLRVTTDPHSPGEFRVNGTVSNMPEFRQAFGCREGQPMAPANACRVW